MSHGTFVWYDLATTDPRAAEEFYGKVVGWTFTDANMPGGGYTIIEAGEIGIGGLMPLSDEMKARGVPSNWTGYVYVNDVDATAAKFTAAGGTVIVGPQDIPQVGRFAVVSDPQGPVLSLFKPLTSESPMADSRTPGAIGWRELVTADSAKAFDFYAGMFGWEKSRGVDMGEMGTYQLFKQASGDDMGGMMNKPMPDMPAYWGYYFNVEAIDAAAKRVTDFGGQVVNGPHEVPGPAYIVNCIDPQGAFFSLVAPAR